jgi:hypothetical protein
MSLEQRKIKRAILLHLNSMSNYLRTDFHSFLVKYQVPSVVHMTLEFEFSAALSKSSSGKARCDRVTTASSSVKFLTSAEDCCSLSALIADYSLARASAISSASSALGTFPLWPINLSNFIATSPNMVISA